MCSLPKNGSYLLVEFGFWYSVRNKYSTRTRTCSNGKEHVTEQPRIQCMHTKTHVQAVQSKHTGALLVKHTAQRMLRTFPFVGILCVCVHVRVCACVCACKCFSILSTLVQSE